MKRSIVTAVGIAVAALLVAAVQPDYGDTRDRLSQETIERLVAEPMMLVRSERLDEAERLFRRLLAEAQAREGAASVAVADLLTAFGVALYTEGFETGDDALRRRSIPYLERAVEAYRAALGPNHRELALALHTFADAVRETSLGPPPRAVDAALEEAYRIRQATLGPRHRETLAAFLAVLQMRGLPSRTGGDRARIAAVADGYATALELARDVVEPGPGETTMAVRLAQARFYALYGMTGEMVGALSRAERESASDFGTCLQLAAGMDSVAEALVVADLPAKAQELRALAAGRSGDCLESLLATELLPPS